jgi:maltose phosphorylase
MSIVEGFGGMRVKDNTLHFAPKIPKEWQGYSFKINFRNQIVKVTVDQKATQIALEGNTAITVVVSGKEIAVAANTVVTV